MTLLTATEATKRLCPIARISARQGKSPDDVPATCCGSECVLWRWVPMSASDHRFKSAVQREIAMMQAEGAKGLASVLHGEAVKRIAAKPDAYTFPDPAVDKGWCGLGGRPE
jgi:hypothetical protein